MRMYLRLRDLEISFSYLGGFSGSNHSYDKVACLHDSLQGINCTIVVSHDL
jgi:hypothetical protein